MSQGILTTNKIKVFISSRCGEGFEKYDFVRKQLKDLIESTKIAEVYLFEGEGASTQSAQQDYLYALDDSDVCLFLIDNADGVTPAIVKEINRAKSHPKKSLYLFCNENQSKPTQIQEELKGAQGSKYYVVENFNDFIKRGSQDFINDICKIYINYCRNRLIDAEFGNYGNEEIEEVSIVSNSLKKHSLKGIDKTKMYIANLLYSFNQEIRESSEMDNYLEQFLKVLWGEKKISEFNTDLFLENLRNQQSDELNEVVSLRWKSIQYYYLNNLDTATIYLNKALELSKEKKLPEWLIQDILIDLRNIESINDQYLNKLVFESKSQKELSMISEELFYPVIDRFDKQLYEDINQRNKKYKTSSIHSITLVNSLNSYIESLSNIFVAACYNGSLTHLLLMRNRVKDVAFQLCEEYINWEFKVLLIKMSILTDSSKNIKKYLSYYNNILGKINSKDAKEIFDVIDSVPLDIEKFKVKLQAFKHLGYFFNDKDFDLILGEILSEVRSWIDREEREVFLGELILTTIQENRFRIDSNLIIEICLKMFDKKMYFFYDDVFILIQRADLFDMDDCNLIALEQALLECVHNNDVLKNSNNLIYALIAYKKKTKKVSIDFEKAIQNNMKESEIELYFLETTNASDDVHLSKLVEKIKNKIENQGKNGIYSFGSQNSYLTIKNIFELNPQKIDDKNVSNILEVCADTLFANNVTYSDKINAIQLIMYINLNSKKLNYNFEELYKKIIVKKENVLIAKDEMLEKHTSVTLKINISMLDLMFGKLEVVELIDLLSEIDNEDEFELTQYLKAIKSLVVDKFFNIVDLSIQNILTQFVLSNKNHKNQEIRFLVVQILLKMITPFNKKMLLTQLSEMMNYDNVYIKNVIILNYNLIKKSDEKIANLILQKAYADNHFLVRKSANEINI